MPDLAVAPAPAGVLPRIDLEAHAFFVAEAYLLDERRFADWLTLLADEFVYRCPIPVIPDEIDKPSYAAVGDVINEDRRSIELWIRRLSLNEAWAENPPQRIRRFLNPPVLVEESPTGRVLDVAILMSWTHQENDPVMIPARRRDILRFGGDGPRLASRTVYLDTALVTATHFRILF